MLVKSDTQIYAKENMPGLCLIHGLGHIFRSEIHAVMTGGFATIAGTVLAAFINFGIKADLLIGNAQ